MLLRRPMAIKLESEGFTVLEGQNGKTGLDIALAAHPDLILLDILMPEMDGIEVLKKLRGDVWGKTAKVVVLTHLNNMEKIAEAAEYGAKEYIVKSDIKLDDLTEKVKTVLA